MTESASRPNNKWHEEELLIINRGYSDLAAGWVVAGMRHIQVLVLRAIFGPTCA